MGGLYGHMSHIHEDLDLTFNDIIDMLRNLSDLRVNSFEKMDGQNINFTIDKAGEIRLARNKGNVQAGGLSTAEYATMWKDHPAQESFMRGFEAIQTALKVLTDKEKQALFSDGNRYQNAEIVYPRGKNIIQYDKPMIRLHEAAILFDRKTGLQAKNDREAFSIAKKLGDFIGSLTVSVRGEEWQIRKPNKVALNTISREHFERASARLETLSGHYASRPVSDWVVSLIMPELLLKGLNENIANHVIDAMLSKQGAMSTVQIKKLVSKDQKLIVSQYTTKLNSAKRIKEKTLSIEMIINSFAMELLRNVSSRFVSNHVAEVKRMQNDLRNSIAALQNAARQNNDPAKNLLDKQMSKLGSIENLASSLEGIVFQYPQNSGRIYKLTGAFAMTNQLIGCAMRMGLLENVEVKADSTPKKIGLIPISAKPYHKGHHMQIQHAAERCDHVYVYISPTDRKRTGELPILASSLKSYWQEHIIPNLPDNVTALSTGFAAFGLNYHPLPSPVSAVYAHIEEQEVVASKDVFYIYSDAADTAKAFPEKSIIKAAPTLCANGQIRFPGIEDKDNLPRIAKGKYVRKALADNDFDLFDNMIPDFMPANAKRSLFALLRNPELKMSHVFPITMG